MVWDIIRSLRKGGVLESEGLPPEFYGSCWDIIGSDFLEEVHYCFLHMQLAASHVLGIVKLLTKPGDLWFFSNWRPITRLNKEYKVISKLLANR